MRQCWEANEGKVCRGVSWERQPLEELLDIVRCVGGAGLAALCRLLAQDQASWSGEPLHCVCPRSPSTSPHAAVPYHKSV